MSAYLLALFLLLYGLPGLLPAIEIPKWILAATAVAAATLLVVDKTTKK